MIAGLLVGVGTTQLSQLATALLLVYVIFYRRRIRIPIALWIVSVVVASSSLWSVSPGKPLLMAVTILSAYIVFRLAPRHRFVAGLGVWMSVEIGIVVWQYAFEGLIRPPAISRNASVLGLVGLFGLPGIPASILVGLSISRTALLGTVIAVLLNPSRKYLIAGGIVVTLSIAVGAAVTPDRYFDPGRVNSDLALRTDAIVGDSLETAPTGVPESRLVRWRWYGYGFGNYVLSTGQIQPHNIFVRTWFEFGVLAIPVFVGLCLLWNLWGRDWRLLVIGLAVGLLTDDLIGSVEGVYMLLIYAIIRESAQQP